jgi:hypothetical protein
VDTDALLNMQGNNNRATPRDQLRILRRLSRLGKKENLAIIAVLVGKPLNKAPEGALFEDVRVRYAKNKTKLEKLLLKRAGSAGTVVTSSPEAEKKLLRRKVNCLRAETFNKVLDSDGENPNPQNNRRKSGGRSRRSGGGRKAPDKPQNNSAPSRKQESGNGQEDDVINDLIDLI